MCYVYLQPGHLVINRLKNWLLSCSSVANFPERSKLKSAEASTKICQVYPGEQTTPEISNLNLAQVPCTILKVYSGAPEQQNVPGGLSPLLGLIGQHVPVKKISAKTSSTDTHLRWEIQKLSSNTNTRLEAGVNIWSDPGSWFIPSFLRSPQAPWSKWGLSHLKLMSAILVMKFSYQTRQSPTIPSRCCGFGWSCNDCCTTWLKQVMAG